MTERDRLVRKMNRLYRLSEWVHRIADRIAARADRAKRTVSVHDRNHGSDDA